MQFNFSSDRVLHLLWMLVFSGIIAMALQYYLEASATMSMGIAVTLTVQINNIVNYRDSESVKSSSMKSEVGSKEKTTKLSSKEKANRMK